MLTSEHVLHHNSSGTRIIKTAQTDTSTLLDFQQYSFFVSKLLYNSKFPTANLSVCLLETKWKNVNNLATIQYRQLTFMVKRLFTKELRVYSFGP